jgi:plasmid maintenance system antidote protein VapI
MQETIIDIESFVKEVKAELKYMGYLQTYLAKITYIPFNRIKTILNGSKSTTPEEIETIKKALGL